MDSMRLNKLFLIDYPQLSIVFFQVQRLKIQSDQAVSQLITTRTSSTKDPVSARYVDVLKNNTIFDIVIEQTKTLLWKETKKKWFNPYSL